MPRLLVETPDEPPKTVDLRDGLTAGRNETADLILLDSQVSRQHLRFRRGERLSQLGQRLAADHGREK